MEMSKNILVATDLCPACDAAAAYALNLGEQTNAAVHFVHGAFAQGNPDNLPPAADVSDKEYEARMNRWVGSIGAARSAPISRVVRGRSPSLALLDYAKRNGIDQIVLGLERNGLRGLILGDRTGMDIIRNAPCPVTIVA